MESRPGNKRTAVTSRRGEDFARDLYLSAAGHRRGHPSHFKAAQSTWLSVLGSTVRHRSTRDLGEDQWVTALSSAVQPQRIDPAGHCADDGSSCS